MIKCGELQQVVPGSSGPPWWCEVFKDGSRIGDLVWSPGFGTRFYPINGAVFDIAHLVELTEFVRNTEQTWSSKFMNAGEAA